MRDYSALRQQARQRRRYGHDISELVDRTPVNDAFAAVSAGGSAVDAINDGPPTSSQRARRYSRYSAEEKAKNEAAAARRADSAGRARKFLERRKVGSRFGSSTVTRNRDGVLGLAGPAYTRHLREVQPTDLGDRQFALGEAGPSSDARPLGIEPDKSVEAGTARPLAEFGQASHYFSDFNGAPRFGSDVVRGDLLDDPGAPDRSRAINRRVARIRAAREAQQQRVAEKGRIQRLREMAASQSTPAFVNEAILADLAVGDGVDPRLLRDGRDRELLSAIAQNPNALTVPDDGGVNPLAALLAGQLQGEVAPDIQGGVQIAPPVRTLDGVVDDLAVQETMAVIDRVRAASAAAGLPMTLEEIAAAGVPETNVRGLARTLREKASDYWISPSADQVEAGRLADEIEQILDAARVHPPPQDVAPEAIPWEGLSNPDVHRQRLLEERSRRSMFG